MTGSIGFTFFFIIAADDIYYRCPSLKRKFGGFNDNIACRSNDGSNASVQ